MSSTYRAEGTNSYSDSGCNHVEKVFTDLQSCSLANETDSQSSYSNSSDLDDDDDDNDRQVKVHFSSRKQEDLLEPNEDTTHEDREIHEQITTVNPPEISNDITDLIREDLYKFVFMPMSKQFSNYIRCRVIRNKFNLFQTFHLEVEYEDNGKSLCLLTAEKELKIISQSQYIISVIPQFTNDSYSAELQSNNITGTSFSLYHLNGDERQQLALILYEANFLGYKGPRKIEALLPKFNGQMQSLTDKNGIDEHYSKEQSNCFIHLHNKPPDWNPYTRSYTLEFDDKQHATTASVKNFQMMVENEEHVQQIVMQFGRISENEFSCDFRYPLSLIQTFGIALSSFESRWFRG